MIRNQELSWILLASLVVLAAPGASCPAEPPPTGFQAEVRVDAPTQLDWQFVAAEFGPKAAQLPAEYTSTRQRYQLFVPQNYDPNRTWPLIVFISPGDDPLGWPSWRKVCEDEGVLFCAAYGAGNNCPPGQRVRIVLDMLDDVRRHYRVSPEETYVTGFSGGGRMACTLAFAMPEYFGGVVAICGTNPLNRLAYLRHRVQARLSVALVTGTEDFNRTEAEEFMFPFFQELGIRSRLWVVPKMGHTLPPPPVLAEVYDWLADDLKRRQEDTHTYPGLAIPPGEVLTPGRQAARQLETAEAELKQAEHTWQGVALLQGTVKRWPRTEAADRARKLLEEIEADSRRMALVAEQGGSEERKVLTAQAEGLERIADLRRALQAWSLLRDHHPDTPEGRRGAREARRLAELPYLGVAFVGDMPTVAQVTPKGPADQAGLRAGDVVVQLGETSIGSLAELRQALQKHRAGDKVELEVHRGSKTVPLTVVLGSLPPLED